MLDSGRAVGRPGSAKAVLRQVCEIIWDDAVGIYPIELDQVYAYREGVEGFVPNPSFPTFTNVTVRR